MPQQEWSSIHINFVPCVRLLVPRQWWKGFLLHPTGSHVSAECHRQTFIAKSKLIKIALCQRLEKRKKKFKACMLYWHCIKIPVDGWEKSVMADTKEMTAHLTSHMTYTLALWFVSKTFLSYFISPSQRKITLNVFRSTLSWYFFKIMTCSSTIEFWPFSGKNHQWKCWKCQF